MTLHPNPAPPRSLPPVIDVSAPCVIVHSNVLVAEDLREILTFAGATEVVVVTALAQAPQGPARIVFIADTVAAVLLSVQGEAWVKAVTPVVILDGVRDAQAVQDAGFHAIDEPFRTEDVTDLLRLLKVF